VDTETASAALCLAVLGALIAVPLGVAAARRDRMRWFAWVILAAGSLAILGLFWSTMGAVTVPDDLGGFTCIREPMVGLFGTEEGEPWHCVTQAREQVGTTALLALVVSVVVAVSVFLATKRPAPSGSTTGTSTS
jgi:ABC-type proline/glycine betaine transport system permease subunit